MPMQNEKRDKLNVQHVIILASHLDPISRSHDPPQRVHQHRIFRQCLPVFSQDCKQIRKTKACRAEESQEDQKCEMTDLFDYDDSACLFAKMNGRVSRMSTMLEGKAGQRRLINRANLNAKVPIQWGGSGPSICDCSMNTPRKKQTRFPR